MSIHVCPRCNMRFLVEGNVIDFEHFCNSGNAAIDNEDVLKVDNWVDYTGSGTVNNTNTLGTENKLFGTRADIEGEDVEDVTKRGARASTHRIRQHLEFIQIQGG